jgi:predicted Zn-dependent peptidase
MLAFVRNALAIFFAASAATVAASAPPKPLAFATQKTALPNGLEVVLHEDHSNPTVSVNLWYHVGSKDEPAGKSGFAHLFEHLMFQGSKHVPEDTFFKFLQRAGATGINGTTAEDRTNYFETVPKNRLELALWLESDRMGFLLDHVDQATFDSQREVVKNERRQSYENTPYGLVRDYMAKAFYPEGHPYRLLPIGSPEDLDRASLADVRAFHQGWYRPNNATLVIAGDIDKKATMDLVERYFGPIPSAPTPARRAAEDVVVPAEKRIEVDAGVDVAQVRVWWPTPKVFAPGDSELDLFGRVLASGKTSRLYARLVDGLQIAQSVSATQDSSQLDSVFEIEVTAQPGHTAEELLAAVDGVLTEMRDGCPVAGAAGAATTAATPAAPAKKGTPAAAAPRCRGKMQSDELARARTVFLAQLVFASEKVATRADRMNAYNQQAGTPDFFERDFARYREATPEAVERTWLERLPLGHRLVALVRPVKGAPVAGVLHADGGAP